VVASVAAVVVAVAAEVGRDAVVVAVGIAGNF
jgi:hypothetical protein